MNLEQAETMAKSLIAEHLQGWTFTWNNRKRAFGLCRYDDKTIQLSRVLTEVETEDATRQTVLHEIAHALAGPQAKHGPIWKAQARRLGVRQPRASREATGETNRHYKYLLMCEGKVLKGYYRHPGQTFVKSLEHRQLRGAPETLGKIKVVPATY